MAFIDSHAHLSSANEAARGWLREMDELGIARSIVVAGGTVTPEKLSEQIARGGALDTDVDNEGLWKVCETSRGRLIPFYLANPHRGARPYLEIGERFAGLKLGPAVHGMPFTDGRVRALVDAAEIFDHPVYLHCLAREGFDVESFVALARTKRGVTFILGHAGIGNCDFHAVALIEHEPNFLFETSGGFTSVVQSAIRRLGPERVLFGSERPL